MNRSRRDKSLARLVADCAMASGTDRDVLFRQLAKSPDRAMDAILHFRGPSPPSVHGRDFYDMYLPRLLQQLVERHPSLFLERPAGELLKANAFLVLGVAISLEKAAFRPLILSGLRAPSIYDRLMVIDAIQHRKDLRTAEARRELERLLTLKSIAARPYTCHRIESTLERFS